MYKRIEVKGFICIIFLAIIYIIYHFLLGDINLSYIMFILGIFLGLLFIDIFNCKSNKLMMPINKKAIYPFFYMYVILVSILIYINVYNPRLIIIYIIIIFTLMIPFFFNIKLSYFNYKISLSTLLYTILLFLVFLVPRILLLGDDFLRLYIVYKGNYIAYFLDFVITFIYPAYYEELLFRGLLLSGLFGLGLNNMHSNIIQSILFGILHFTLYNKIGPVGVFETSIQIMLGYLLGKLYLKTNSLTPSIIFHVLLNMI